ncbi:hypothetical protein [Candidatus Avelusimicrobium luingense]|uniref:hypothetical protein n=1 Tax=Candidatus Avelusimicrobium luingense TaxID=3416211 RepID=UPI003D0B36E6
MKTSHLLSVVIFLGMITPASAQVVKGAKAGLEVGSNIVAEIQFALSRAVATAEMSTQAAVRETAQAERTINQMTSQLERMIPRNATDDYYSTHSEGRYAVHTVQSSERYMQQMRRGLGEFNYREYHAPSDKSAKKEKEEKDTNTDEQPTAAAEETPQGTASENVENPEQTKVPAVSGQAKTGTVSAEMNKK